MIQSIIDDGTSSLNITAYQTQTQTQWTSPSPSASRRSWLRHWRHRTLDRKQLSAHASRRQLSGLTGKMTCIKTETATVGLPQCRRGPTCRPEVVWRPAMNDLLPGCRTQRRQPATTHRVVVLSSVNCLTSLPPTWHRAVICQVSFSRWPTLIEACWTWCTLAVLQQSSRPLPASRRSLRSPTTGFTTPPPSPHFPVGLDQWPAVERPSQPGRCRQRWQVAAVRSTRRPVARCAWVVDHQRRLSSHQLEQRRRRQRTTPCRGWRHRPRSSIYTVYSWTGWRGLACTCRDWWTTMVGYFHTFLPPSDSKITHFVICYLHRSVKFEFL